MSAPTGVFQLQFSPSEIKSLSSNYKLDQEEHAAFDAGARILSGDFNRKNLDPIFRWKVRDRGKSRPLLNTDEELSDALQLAVLAKTPRAAISVLTGLSGVAVPVASAIMTAIKPEYYTIIDFRALEALGHKPRKTNNPQYIPVTFYLHYLKFCIELAGACSVTLRDLDRALWQWSKQGRGRIGPP